MHLGSSARRRRRRRAGWRSTSSSVRTDGYQNSIILSKCSTGQAAEGGSSAICTWRSSTTATPIPQSASSGVPGLDRSTSPSPPSPPLLHPAAASWTQHRARSIRVGSQLSTNNPQSAKRQREGQAMLGSLRLPTPSRQASLQAPPSSMPTLLATPADAAREGTQAAAQGKGGTRCDAQHCSMANLTEGRVATPRSPPRARAAAATCPASFGSRVHPAAPSTRVRVLSSGARTRARASLRPARTRSPAAKPRDRAHPRNTAACGQPATRTRT